MGMYRFVGSYCEIDGGRIKLERFGQQIELSDEVAEVVVKGGGAIIPEAEFEQIGFTEQELSLYAYPGQQSGAPEAWITKRKAAHLAYHNHRQQKEAE
ncbi:MAG: hypothetical protein KGL39_37590 [Patescibacteria group bacterium]|nr:hypothetical protein [Patescibacteria group bacterium]